MNLAYLIDRAAKWYPDSTAVVDSNGRYSYQEVYNCANQFAHALTRLGHEKGDRVAIICRNCVEYIETDFALYKTGLIRVALNPRLSAAEMTIMINDAEASSLIVSSDYAEIVDRMRPELKTVKHFIIADKSHQGMLGYHKLIENEPTSSSEVELSEDDLALLFYTGGTTGIPKGAMHSHKGVITVTMNLQADAFHVTSNDAILSSGTMAHANGFRTTLAWIKGAKHVLTNGFDPRQILELVQREKVTMLTTVPTTLARLCEYPDLTKYDLSSLRLITYGASPMPVDQLKTALKIFGQRMIQIYGQAEAPITITVLRPEEHMLEGTDEEVKRLASVGRPYSTGKVGVVDESGNQVKPGEVGEIIVQSPHCMSGYWKRPEATLETLRNGWIYTGDLATVDEKEYIYIVDRAKDIIISGGYNVYAREVEEVLYTHPAVREAAVIGVPDKNWGEAVKAIVALRPGVQVTERELIDYCRQNMTSYKKPQSVEFMPELPKSSTDKILKRELKEKYWQGYDKRVH
jgi:long-chain acyl-CoA synthetase